MTIVLHDPAANRAVLYDEPNETPLPGRGFTGPSAQGQAESFLGWLRARRYENITANDLWGTRAVADGLLAALPELADPRSYTPEGMAKVRLQWAIECLDGHGGLSDYGDALADWFATNSLDPPPAP